VDATLLRFAAVLRQRGVRLSVAEVEDAARAVAAVGLQRRGPVRLALEAALVKDARDLVVFDELFDLFFRLRPVDPPEAGNGHDHAHDDLTDTGQLHDFTLSESPSPEPQTGHSHDEPVDIREYFDEEDLASSYNLHQEAHKIDLASMTDELVLSADQTAERDGLAGVQMETSRLKDAASAKDLAAAGATQVDAELSVSQGLALDQLLAQQDDAPVPEHLRGLDLEGLVVDLPELLKRHLERFLALGLEVDAHEASPFFRERISERERRQLEEVLSRLGRSVKGALTHRKRPAASGRIDVSRTMARNMRYDGVPFQPVTTSRREDKPRLVVLADASMSVRNSARFTFHLVHGLQRLFPRVRTYAFVDAVTDVTVPFEVHGLEDALGLVFGADLLDVDASSDYGAVFADFAADHLSVVTRRTTVLVLGDGRSGGRDPGLEALEQVRRQCRRLVWLTPEPRYSWGLGSCDLPAYARLCDRVEVVRDVQGLDSTVRALVDVLA
jgi:uncharacterized protein with von Willebrand factor type A (vWA) domain